MLLVTFAPAVALDARELWRDVIRLQFYQPVRLDALSVLALVGQEIEVGRWAVWPAFVGAAGAIAAALARERTPARAAAAAAAAWLLFVVLNKNAFANYYWLATGLLATAIAALDAPRTIRAAGNGTQGPSWTDSQSARSRSAPP